MNKSEKIRTMVRENYGTLAESGSAGCGCAPSCCGESRLPEPRELARLIGYSDQELQDMPDGANMGLGCGNPQALADLKPGETVVDLGCGGGFDCFLAARQVGREGNVIGVDMTPEMIGKARENGEKGGFQNVEFRLGEIEHLPVADNTADVILSNCVINLAPDKEMVYREAFRVLKPGGRLAISDVVALAEIPDEIRTNPALYCGCAGGAAQVIDLEKMLAEAGFEHVQIRVNEQSREIIREWFPGTDIEKYVASATIEAKKPLEEKQAT